jgi:hypothetical protein
MSWVDNVRCVSKCLDTQILLFETLINNSIKNSVPAKSGKVPNVTRTNHEQNYNTN